MIKEKLKKIPLVRRTQKFLLMNSSKNTAIQTNGYEIIDEVDKVMTTNNISYFIDFGTLLGIVREGKLLSFDIDIDFGVLDADLNTKTTIRKKLKEIGYIRTERHEVNGDVKEESYQRDNCKFDIFYYERYQEGVYCYIFCRVDGVKYENQHEISAGIYRYNMNVIPERKIINNREFSIPMESEALLEMKYGKNWRIPNKYWHYWYDSNVEIQENIGTWIEGE